MTFVPYGTSFARKNTPASDPGSMCLLVSSYDFCPPSSTLRYIEGDLFRRRNCIQVNRAADNKLSDLG